MVGQFYQNPEEEGSYPSTSSKGRFRQRVYEESHSEQVRCRAKASRCPAHAAGGRHPDRL